MREPSSSALSAVAVLWLLICVLTAPVTVCFVLLMLMMPGGSGYTWEIIVRYFALPAFLCAGAFVGAMLSAALLLHPRSRLATALLVFTFVWPAVSLWLALESPFLLKPNLHAMVPLLLVLHTLSAVAVRWEGSQAFLRLREEDAARRSRHGHATAAGKQRSAQLCSPPGQQ